MLYIFLIFLQIFTVMIKHQNFTPDETKNPFAFENHSLTSYVYKLNGLQVSDRIEVDFGKNKFLRAYRSLIDAVGIGSGNAGFGLTLADFKTGSCILALDLTPDLCSKCISQRKFSEASEASEASKTLKGS